MLELIPLATPTSSPFLYMYFQLAIVPVRPFFQGTNLSSRLLTPCHILSTFPKTQTHKSKIHCKGKEKPPKNTSHKEMRKNKETEATKGAETQEVSQSTKSISKHLKLGGQGGPQVCNDNSCNTMPWTTIFLSSVCLWQTSLVWVVFHIPHNNDQGKNSFRPPSLMNGDDQAHSLFFVQFSTLEQLLCCKMMTDDFGTNRMKQECLKHASQWWFCLPCYTTVGGWRGELCWLLRESFEVSWLQISGFGYCCTLATHEQVSFSAPKENCQPHPRGHVPSAIMALLLPQRTLGQIALHLPQQWSRFNRWLLGQRAGWRTTCV